MRTWWWKWRQISRRLWVRTTLIGFLGIATALLAAVVESWIPWQVPAFVKVDAIESLLTIIASSMLAVTTFSLGIMTSAYGSASNGVTPRATKLLMEDSLTQTVLASFIGSFIFSIVGMIVLRFGAYGERGRVVLFVVTIGVIALIVINLLRWIDYLTRFGRSGETIDRVEAATQAALSQRLAQPFLGANLWSEPARIPDTAQSVRAAKVGVVQHIDMPALQEAAQALNARIFIEAVPGKQLFMDSALAWLAYEDGRSTPPDDAPAWLEKVHSAFVIATSRDFEQDPRFGMAVMCEIASRALSPATNDAGTALDIIARSTRLLSFWAVEQAQQATPHEEVQYPSLYVPALQSADLFDDAFTLMARDGAGLIEVQLSLQKSLAALSRLGNADFQQAAREQAALALARAENALTLEQDKQRLRALVVGLYPPS